MRRSILLVNTLLLLLACAGNDPEGAGGAPASTGSGAGTTSSSGGAGATGGSGGAGIGAGGGGAGAPDVYGFPDDWIDGTNCTSEPDVQVHAYAEDTFILRQSICTHFEGPFIYVFMGDSQVFVQDTGTGDVNLYAEVVALAEDYAATNSLASLPILVTHSHAHGDHVGGDGQFQGQSGVTVVGTSVNAVSAAFGFASWPDDQVTIDLGGRVLDVLAIPGHQSAHVAVYDRRHQLLLTGDTLYPGRLYINDWSDYRDSIQRMVDFVGAGNAVSWVLGTHIEMDVAGDDYPIGASSHPNEHELQLGYPVLEELHQAVQAMGNTPQYEAHDDFIIYP